MNDDRKKKPSENRHGYAITKPTWRQRIRRFLFPVELCFPPKAEFDDKDMLITRIVCVFSLIPRLRFLITGRLVVETRTVTENVIGKHAASSACYVATKGMTE